MRIEHRNPNEMTFLEHLDELRTRLLRIVIVLAVSFGVCAAFSRPIFRLAMAPITPFLHGERLVFTKLGEPFFMYLKISFLACLFLAAPYVLSELWLFVSPGLYPRERRMAVPFVFFASALFLLGGAFAYFFVFPATCRFFLQVGEDFKPMLKIDEYLSLFSVIILAVGAVFEIPAVIFILSRAGIVTPRFLAKNFKYAILLSFTVAAIVTPTPDPVTCSAVAVPMIGLYGLGILVAMISRRKPAETEKAMQTTEQTESSAAPE